MPATAGEAFYQAAAELYLGTCAGVAGLLLDPAAGASLPGALSIAGVALGVMKGAGGLMVRPVVGTLDASSKCLRGFGLLCLGRRGIQGKLVRRVRPPGALEPSPQAAAAAAGAGSARHGAAAGGGMPVTPSRGPLMHAALVASWQVRLPVLSKELEGDTVMEVLATRSCRLLLLTSRHVLYLKASLPTRGSNAGSCSYSMRWCLACDKVDHVRGAEENLRIILEFHTQLKLPQLRGWWARRAAAAAAAKGRTTGSGSSSGSPADAAAMPAAAAVDVSPQGSQLQPPRQGQEPPQQQQQHGPEDANGSSRVLLRVPLHRSLRCATPELYQRVIRSISRHLVQAPAAAALTTTTSAARLAVDAQHQLQGAETGSSAGRMSDISEEDYKDLYSVA